MTEKNVNPAGADSKNGVIVFYNTLEFHIEVADGKNNKVSAE
jgi:hypothetical protein